MFNLSSSFDSIGSFYLGGEQTFYSSTALILQNRGLIIVMPNIKDRVYQIFTAAFYNISKPQVKKPKEIFEEYPTVETSIYFQVHPSKQYII